MAKLRPREFVVNCNRSLQSCVYTVIPISNQRLLDSPYHLNRLQDSYARLCGHQNILSSPCNQDLLLQSMARTLIDNGSSEGNGVLTVCMGRDGKNELAAYSILTDLPGYVHQDGGVIVDTHIYTRATDPLVKAASWPEERVYIEKVRSKHASETILCRRRQGDDDNRLLAKEGLVSNFFVVDGSDTLITAPRGEVLEGSMQRLVLATAEALGIKVERRYPELSLDRSSPSSSSSSRKMYEVKGAFLTSATKPIATISSILSPEGGEIYKFDMPLSSDSVITVLREQLSKVLSGQEADFLRKQIPYDLWSIPIAHERDVAKLQEYIESTNCLF